MENEMKLMINAKTKLSHIRKRNKILRLGMFHIWQRINDTESYFKSKDIFNN